MAKPRIKLKSARATAQGQRDLDRALHLLAEAVGMTPSQVMRNPHTAKSKWQLKEAEAQQAKAKLATELAPVLNMTTEHFIRAPQEEIERRLEELKQERANAAVAEYRNNAMAAIQACQVTGQMRIAQKAVDQVAQGMPMDRVRDYIFDLAAAESDGLAIHNGHSPEGGHKKAIDYAKIYDRQNGRKGERA